MFQFYWHLVPRFRMILSTFILIDSQNLSWICIIRIIEFSRKLLSFHIFYCVFWSYGYLIYLYELCCNLCFLFSCFSTTFFRSFSFFKNSLTFYSSSFFIYLRMFLMGKYLWIQSVAEFLKGLPSHDENNFANFHTDNGNRTCVKRPSVYLPTKDYPSEQSTYFIVWYKWKTQCCV